MTSVNLYSTFVLSFRTGGNKMKSLQNFLLLFFISIILISCTKNNDNISSSVNNSDMVYVCTGPYAKAYHKDKDCKGLTNCSKEIKTISLNETQQMKRYSCRYCN